VNAPTPILAGADLGAVFPFYVLLDTDGTVLSAGPGLRRVLPGLAPGTRLRDRLTPTRPEALATADDWLRFDGQAVLLETVQTGGLSLRGQLCRQPDQRVLLLLRPKVQSFEDLKTHGLQLDDLAAHDATGDLLLLQRAAQTSREDARRLTDRLRQKTQQLQLMSELSAMGMGYFSASGELRQSNRLLNTILGVEPGAPAFRNVGDVEQHLRGLVDASDAVWLRLDELALHANEDDGAFVLRTRDGRHLSLLYRSGGDHEHVLFVRDVTRETLVDRMKSEFLTLAAHELRTPMTSIFGFSELLIHRTLTPERFRDTAATIHKQAAWMVSLLDEVLDVARIEAKQSGDLHLSAVHLSALLPDTINAYGNAHQNTELRLDLPADLPPLRADRVKAGQALGNVISNAIKYSPNGGIVDIRCRPQAKGSLPGLLIEVQDHGMGMSEEQVARIFERFYRADPSGHIPGTGLGMTLVEQIMKLHRGTVKVASTLGQGTCVSLWFPTATDADPNESAGA
jgi:signal transduction histidine kinase